MFESNFPVDRASCTYLVLWNAFKRIVSDASPADKAMLFTTPRRTFTVCDHSPEERDDASGRRPDPPTRTPWRCAHSLVVVGRSQRGVTPKQSLSPNHRREVRREMRSGVERGDDDRLDCLAASGGGNGILDLREAEPMSDEIGKLTSEAIKGLPSVFSRRVTR